MPTGEIRNQVDQIRNSFRSRGSANPLEVIEQITYLLLISRLDELHTLQERKVARTKRPIARRVPKSDLPSKVLLGAAAGGRTFAPSLRTG